MFGTTTFSAGVRREQHDRYMKTFKLSLIDYVPLDTNEAIEETFF